MILDFCVMCGTKKNLHNHHVVPRALGGSDKKSNLITVCVRCHAKIHGLPSHTWVHNREMAKRTYEKNKTMRKFNACPPKITTLPLKEQKDIFKKISKRSRNSLRNKILFLLIISKVRITEICQIKWKHIVGDKIKIPGHGEVKIKEDLILLLKELLQQQKDRMAKLYRPTITEEDFILRTERAKTMNPIVISTMLFRWSKL